MRTQRNRNWFYVGVGGCVVGLLTGCGEYDYELGWRPETGSSGGESGGAGLSGTGGESGGGGETGAGGEAGAGGSAGGAPEVGIVGWASITDCGPSGTTGGREGPTLTPQSATELAEAVRADGPSIIQISGRFDLGDAALQISSDKTLVGLEGAELVGATRVYNARNVILKNILFNGGPTAEGVDAVEVTGSTCVWIDHCEFFDGADSNLDIVRGSDLVTVSWSKFYHAMRTGPHRVGSVCGGSDDDTPGKINVTFHHNWWMANLLEEMPRVRHGKVHLFNNYYSSFDNTYCVGAGYMAKLLVQNNVFEGVNDPIVFEFDEEVEGSGIHTAEIVETGNDYTTATGEPVRRGTSFEPPYPYTLQAADAAKVSVIAAAGPEP